MSPCLLSNSTESGTGSTNIRAAVTRPLDENTAYLRGMPFESSKWFETGYAKNKYDVVFLSLLPVANHKVYRLKGSDFTVALGSRVWPLCDKKNWPMYVDKGEKSLTFSITQDSLKLFCEKFEPVNDYLENGLANDIMKLLSVLPQRSKICFLLMNEHAYSGCDDDYSYKKQANDVVRSLCEKEPRIRCIDVNEFVLSADDTTDGDSHFTSKVYYELSQRLAKEINELGGDVRYYTKNPVLVRIGQKFRTLKELVTGFARRGGKALSGLFGKHK